MTEKRPTDRRNQDLYIGVRPVACLASCRRGADLGLGIIRELGRHGYRLGPGTVYPLLHSMERRGWLRTVVQLVEGRRRKTYSATAAGRTALKRARVLVRELYEEMQEAGE